MSDSSDARTPRLAALGASALYATFAVRMATLPRGGFLAHTAPDDAFYYLAIAREAQSRRPGSQTALTQALAAWRAYATDGGPRAPWMHRVRTHIQAIELSLTAQVRASALRAGAARAPRAAVLPR